MIATAIARKSDGRPRTAGDELVLRVYGFPNDGRLVRLRAYKCTIGSGPRCTLRLQAPGVAALHCLIVRGPAGAVVRRWSPDTLLNQQAFADAKLSPGDILNIGPVTIEVLSTGANIQRAPEDAQTDEKGNELRAELESQRRSLDERRNRWESEQAESRRMLDEQQAEIDKLSAELNGRQNELLERQTAMRDEHNSLAEQRERWETEQAESRSKLDDERSQLNQRKAELDELRGELTEQLESLHNEQNSLVEQRGRWETERAESRRKLDDERTQLDEQKAELEKQRNELAEQLARQEAAEGDKAGQTEHIDTQLNELEDRRESLEQERLNWQAAQVQAQKHFDEEKSLLAEQIAELDRQQASLADERNDLQAEQKALAEQRNAWESEREEYQRQLDQRNERLAEQESELENERKRLAEERAEFQSEQNTSAEQRDHWEKDHPQNMPAEEHAETPADIEPAAEITDEMPAVEPRTEEEPENLEFKTPDDKAPVDLDEVFRRIGASFEKDGHGEEPRPSAQQAERPEIEYDPRDKPVATAKNGAVQDDRHEESVEDYMNRLMKRVRESTSETAAPSYTPPVFGRSAARESGVADSAVSNEAPVSSATFPEPPRREPAQMPPRKSVPEKDINLSALRELANLSAHSAISRYTHRTLTSSMYSKLLVVVVSLASTGVLLWMWRTMSGRQITFYSALIALLVAIYWGVQYALVSGRLMINKSGRIEWKSADAFGKGSSKEETVEDTVQEKADAPQAPEA